MNRLTGHGRTSSASARHRTDRGFLFLCTLIVIAGSRMERWQSCPAGTVLSAVLTVCRSPTQARLLLLLLSAWFYVNTASVVMVLAQQTSRKQQRIDRSLVHTHTY